MTTTCQVPETVATYRVRWIDPRYLSGDEQFACSITKTLPNGGAVTYRVVMTWHGRCRCNCRAGRFGKSCKHVTFCKRLFDRQVEAF